MPSSTLNSTFQNPNVVHFELLITAEFHDIRSNQRRRDESKARHKYREAIRRARDRGWLRDQAIAHQRFGEFYQRRGQVDQARDHLQQAVSLFDRWGARTVANRLLLKVAGILGDTKEED